MAQLTYDALSRRTALWFTDYSGMSYAYDAADRLKMLTHSFVTSANNFVEGYDYDAAGREVYDSIGDASLAWSPWLASSAYGAVNALNQYPSVDGVGLSAWPEGPAANDKAVSYFYDETTQLAFAALRSDSSTGAQYAPDATGRVFQAWAVRPGGTDALSWFLTDGARPEILVDRLY